MKTPSVRIALPKLFLWSEAARIQEYPEALSKAEAGRDYSRVEIERELLDVTPTMRFQHGAPRGSRTDGIVNLYGMERSGGRWRLNGLGLLERSGGHARVTADGLRLGTLFREHPHDLGWAVELAKLIATREPRTRLVLWLMLHGAELTAGFSDSESNRSLELRWGAKQVLTIRWARTEEFNGLLQEHSRELLGPYWSQLIQPSSAPVLWEGVVRGSTPSTNGLSMAVRRSLGLFHYIGLLEGSGREWGVTPAHFGQLLGAQALRSFGHEGAAPVRLTDDEHFARALRDCTDAEGFLIVSQLVERFGEFLKVPDDDRAAVLDSYIRTAMYHDQLRVLDRHPGQPRMGRGLFGEPGARRVRIEFTPIPKNTNVKAAEQTPAGSSNEMQGEDR
jgi:hypothetical protein